MDPSIIPEDGFHRIAKTSSDGFDLIRKMVVQETCLTVTEIVWIHRNARNFDHYIFEPISESIIRQTQAWVLDARDEPIGLGRQLLRESDNTLAPIGRTGSLIPKK